MSYTLKPSTDSVYFIHRNRTRVGSVFKHRTDDIWVGKVGNDVVRAATAKDAFHAIVRLLNRVAICGENNEEKARDALERRNAQAMKEATDFNRLVGFEVVKVRNRKVMI